MTTPGEPATPGRPRSERARQAVLTAARELLTDKGLPGLSVDDIARSAGVSKNTIYRWWPNKAAVLMDAFAEATSPKLEFPADGDALTNLRTQVRQVAHLMNAPAPAAPSSPSSPPASTTPNWPQPSANASSPPAEQAPMP